MSAAELREAPALVRAAVEVENLSFTYLDADCPALLRVSLSVAAGEMIGVVGASGAGKSTLAKCLNRIIPAFEGGVLEGSVTIAGESLEGLAVWQVAPKVGMVFQDFESQLFSTNVMHEAAFAMEQLGFARDEIVERVADALAAVGLTHLKARDPTTLSGGEKQRLAIAAVLALRPRVIVLDEPTTDLDPEGRAEVFALIHKLRESGLSLIVIEHETEELRLCDRIVLMREGEIVAQGPPARVLGRLDLMEQCGVRPPDLYRLMAELGLDVEGASREAVEAELTRVVDPERLAAYSSTQSQPPERRTAVQPIVQVEEVSHSYFGGALALDRVSLTVRPGEFVAIVGQNGSGKTTLAKHIVGLLEPMLGQVRIGSRNRSELSSSQMAAQVGYVFQNPDHQIFAGTVEEEVAFGLRNFGLPKEEIRARCDKFLRATGLEAVRHQDPFRLNRGERQRVAVAGVLALQPQLLILDEPTTGLDYREVRRMMALITELNRAGTAVIIITHTPWLVAEHARRVVLMRAGRKLFDGPTREFFADEALMASSSFRASEAIRLARRLGLEALSAQELAQALRDAGIGSVG